MSLRHDCRGRQIFCRSCLSFLARFCRNKLSGCRSSHDRQASLLHYAFQASSCQSICLQRMLSSTSVFSYMMPSKPLAAKSSVFKLPKQRSSTATSFMMSRRQSLRNQTSPKTDYNDFSKMLGYFYGDIVGLEVASGLRSDQPCRRRVGNGDEFNKAAPAPSAPAAPAPAAGENGARPADEPPTTPAGEGVRPARAPCRARRLPSQTAAADEK